MTALQPLVAPPTETRCYSVKSMRGNRSMMGLLRKKNRRRREIFLGQSSAILSRRHRQTPVVCSASSRISCAAMALWATNASSPQGPWHTLKAETRHLPDSTCLAPPSPSVTLRRWLHTPPPGEFEQVVLYRYGPAQVGLNQSFTSCWRLAAPFETEPTMPAAHTLGWSGRRHKTPLAPPGAVYDLEFSDRGEGWIALDWKKPKDGGNIASYKIQCREDGSEHWSDVGVTLEPKVTLSGQESGKRSCSAWWRSTRPQRGGRVMGCWRCFSSLPKKS